MTNNHGSKIPGIDPEPGPYLHLNGNRAKLASGYRRALYGYLEHRDDKRLQSAYKMGCRALRGGMGVFDLARLHEGTLAEAITTAGTAGPRLALAAEAFLLDALSPVAAARRGLPDAYVRLQCLDETLERRTRELASASARQRPIEKALRASQERCCSLSRKTRSMKADLRQRSANVILAQEDERKRLSRELHDEVGQVLAAVNVDLVMLKRRARHDRSLQRRVSATQALLERSMESVHRFARELRPEMVDLFGPFEAIRSYVRAFAERTGITADVQSDADLAGLDSDQKVTLFRVAQESMTNIYKHAHATRVEVRFGRISRGIQMEIQDNGRSFSVCDKLGAKGSKRLGLLGMQERVRLGRGNFSIESEPGRGTKVRVTFPLGPARRTVPGAKGTKASGRASGPAGSAESSL